MSITAIRKTKLPYKGGPGAAGVRFDPVAKQLKVHDGTTEKVVAVGAPVAAGSVTTVDHIKTVLTAFGILTP